MTKRPNILYMHSHDTGRAVQPYGYPIATPNLQRLAEEGVLFRQAFCCGPTCSPSRAALLFGQSPHSVGMLGLSNLGWSIKDMGQHLHHHLKRNGYVTALCGTQHIASENVREIGYDQVVPTAKRPLADAACDWLDGWVDARQEGSGGASGEQPFFLSLGHWLTHRHRYLEPTDAEKPGYLSPPGPMPDHPDVRQDVAAFHASCKQLDRDWGQVLDALDRLGLAENTLVICTTDHGIGYPNMKCSLFDGGLGVMLMMRGPGGPDGSGGFTGGRVSDALVSHLDVYPTVCEVAGIEPPDWLEGRSLGPLARGEAAAIRDEIFGEITYHCSYQPERCVRTQRYKYIRRFDETFDRFPQPNVDDGLSKALWQRSGWDQQVLPREALYDLVFDPHEQCNLAGEARYADVLGDLRGRLDQWMRRTDDPLRHGPVPRPSGGKMIEANQRSNTGPWVEIP